MQTNRRQFVAHAGGTTMAALLLDAGASAAPTGISRREEPPIFPGVAFDFHGFPGQQFTIDGCVCVVVTPKTPLPGRLWVWRTMFWNAFPDADVALLNRGYYVAFVEVGNTFGCPDAMKHFDSFYALLTDTYGLATKVTLEGLSRGGLSCYRWATVNTNKVACIYGDAAVCDMKSWPGGKGKGTGSPADWAEAMKVYHMSTEAEMLTFKGNPIDVLGPIAAARIPLIHVYGDADKTVPPDENTVILRDRYIQMGGGIAVIVKEGCDHHPHGLADPGPVVDFIVAHTATGQKAAAAAAVAPKSGSVLMLPQGKW